MTEHEVLFIPGPVEVDAELRAIMAQPLIGHRNPKFVDEVKSVCDKLQLVFQTDWATSGSTTLFENAPATAVMEAGCPPPARRMGRMLLREMMNDAIISIHHFDAIIFDAIILIHHFDAIICDAIILTNDGIILMPSF